VEHGVVEARGGRAPLARFLELREVEGLMAEDLRDKQVLLFRRADVSDETCARAIFRMLASFGSALRGAPTTAAAMATSKHEKTNCCVSFGRPSTTDMVEATTTTTQRNPVHAVDTRRCPRFTTGLYAVENQSQAKSTSRHVAKRIAGLFLKAKMVRPQRVTRTQMSPNSVHQNWAYGGAGLR
jgi:hypothetical protein